MKLKEFKTSLKPLISKNNFSSRKNIVNKLLFGNIISQVKNKGFEFEDYIKYSKTDDAQRIDWKASLKANQLLIRQTLEEKAVNVVFLVNVSDTMLFSSSDKLKCEYAADIIIALSYVIQREGNAIGLCLYNDKIVKVLHPKIGKKQYFDIIKEVTNPKNYGGGCDLKNAIKQVYSILKTPSLLIILSDFIESGKDWEKYISIVSLKYQVLGISIKDPRDRRIPKNSGYFVIEDPSSNEKMIIDTSDFHSKYESKVLDDEEYVNKAFKKANASCMILETNQEFSIPIISFLEKRARIKR